MEFNSEKAREAANFVQETMFDPVVIHVDQSFEDNIKKILDRVQDHANLGNYSVELWIKKASDSSKRKEILDYLRKPGLEFEVYLYKRDLLYDTLAVMW